MTHSDTLLVDSGTKRFKILSFRGRIYKMSELEDLLRQKAEIEARIEKVRASEIDDLKRRFADMAYQLRELNALPAALVEAFTDKAGTFNVFRTMKVKKPS